MFNERTLKLRTYHEKEESMFLHTSCAAVSFLAQEVKARNCKTEEMERNEMYPQVADAVAFAQCDLKHLQSAEKSSESTETLFPTSTHTDQQRVPHRRLQNTTDPATTHKDSHIHVMITSFRQVDVKSGNEFWCPHMCCMASSNSTRFMSECSSL